MTDELTKDIAEAINKNLPAHVGTTLLQRLKKAEEDSNALAVLKGKADAKNMRILELEDYIAKHKSIDDREIALMMTAKKLDDKTKELTVKEAVLAATERFHYATLSAAKEGTENLKDMLRILFTNTQVKRQVLEQTAVYPKRDDYGNVKNDHGLYDEPKMKTTGEKTEMVSEE